MIEIQSKLEEDQISNGCGGIVGVAASHPLTVSTPSYCLQSGYIKILLIDRVFVHFAECNEYPHACITRD